MDQFLEKHNLLIPKQGETKFEEPYVCWKTEL